MVYQARIADLGHVRVLLVEDNVLVGEVVAAFLRRQGADVVGPVADVPAAMDLVQRQPFDAAVLDVDVQGQTTAPVALRLRSLECPFVFLSGYGVLNQLPPELAREPHLSKPVHMDVLAAVVRGLVNREPGPGLPAC